MDVQRAFDRRRAMRLPDLEPGEARQPTRRVAHGHDSAVVDVGDVEPLLRLARGVDHRRRETHLLRPVQRGQPDLTIVDVGDRGRSGRGAAGDPVRGVGRGDPGIEAADRRRGIEPVARAELMRPPPTPPSSRGASKDSGTGVCAPRATPGPACARCAADAIGNTPRNRQTMTRVSHRHVLDCATVLTSPSTKIPRRQAQSSRPHAAPAAMLVRRPRWV